MDNSDPFEVLGVSRSANTAEIRAAYRKLALLYHPDRNPGDAAAERRFKEVVLAHGVLRDPERRAAHLEKAGGGLGDYAEPWEALFSEMFQRARRDGTPSRGADLHHSLTVTFEEAAAGAEKKLAIERWVICTRCGGGGRDPEGVPAPCPHCGGEGEVRHRRGLAEIVIPCGPCGGEGAYVRERCLDCGGAGRQRHSAHVSVRVPAGAEAGAEIRFRELGDEGARREPGDLYVTLAVAPHPFFYRAGRDICCDVPITFSQAALGGEVEVPTLGGRERLVIPAGVQSGQVFRFRGKGISAPGGGQSGDHCVRVVLETPPRLTAAQRALLEEWARVSPETAHPQRRRFEERLRDWKGAAPGEEEAGGDRL